MDKYPKNKTGIELEKTGAELFTAIGLKCFSHLDQIKLSDITPGYSENENVEFDYIIPEGKLCLISF